MPESTFSIDSQPVPHARLEDLDFTAVQQHISTAKERGRYMGTADPTAYLRRYHGITDVDATPVPTLAGILAFAPDGDHLLPASGVDVVEFSGTTTRSTDIRFIEQVRGTLFAVIDRVTEILWDRSEHGYQLQGAQRVEEHAYPQVVLRELTVNALCHRDWSKTGSRVRVQIFPNGIEWISPGGLPEGVTIQNLLEAQFSRNPALVGLLFQGGYIEALGLGMDTVFGTLRDAGSDLPHMKNAPHAFTIRVTAKPLGVRETTLVTQIADRQAAICDLIAQRGALSISEIEEALDVQRRTIQRDLGRLVKEGRLVVAGATNNRRYQLPADDAV